MKIACLVGTRPDIIKMYPIINEVSKRGHELVLIHTGQHYDFNMSDAFIKYLKIPVPHHFLNVKSSHEGAQTAKIMKQSEEVLMKEKPLLILVLGDTNSALGAAIAASKLRIPVGHVEAGCRSFDKNMSEEINRVVISHLASFQFVPTENCRNNLLLEGIPLNQIYLTGHPIVDLIKTMRKRISQSDHHNKNLITKPYALATVHRRENITSVERLTNILGGLKDISTSLRLLFPCHPHTMKQVKRFSLEHYLDGLTVLEPISYVQCLELMTNARVVVTDSGGIQQEAALLHTPCITVRDRTEWIETISARVNFLVGANPKLLRRTFDQIMTNRAMVRKRFSRINIAFGKPGVATRVIKIVENKLSN